MVAGFIFIGFVFVAGGYYKIISLRIDQIG